MAGEFASSFNAGLQSAESDRDYLFRKAQFDAQAPIRAAQVSLMGSQIQSANLKATMDAIAAQNAIKAQGSMAEALSFQGSLEGNYSPQNEAQFYNFVSKNPQLANTPWFTGMQKDFDVAKQLSSKADLLQQQLASQEMRAAEHNITLKQLFEEKAKLMEELEKMRQEGKANPNPSSQEVTRREMIALMVKEQGLTPAEAEKEYDRQQALKKIPTTPESKKLQEFFDARKQNPNLTYTEFANPALNLSSKIVGGTGQTAWEATNKLAPKPKASPAATIRSRETNAPRIVREFKLK